MLFGDASLSGLFIDIVLFVAVVCMLCFEIVARRDTGKKMAEIKQKIAALEHFQSDLSAILDEEFATLKETLLEKVNRLTNRINELSKKTSMMYERNKAIQSELDRKVNPLKASINDTAAKFSSSHDAIRKIVQQGRNEIDTITKDIDIFAQEIQKMKDFIRGRTIDLEL